MNVCKMEDKSKEIKLEEIIEDTAVTLKNENGDTELNLQIIYKKFMDNDFSKEDFFNIIIYLLNEGTKTYKHLHPDKNKFDILKMIIKFLNFVKIDNFAEVYRTNAELAKYLLLIKLFNDYSSINELDKDLLPEGVKFDALFESYESYVLYEDTDQSSDDMSQYSDQDFNHDQSRKTELKTHNGKDDPNVDIQISDKLRKGIPVDDKIVVIGYISQIELNLKHSKKKEAVNKLDAFYEYIKSIESADTRPLADPTTLGKLKNIQNLQKFTTEKNQRKLQYIINFYESLKPEQHRPLHGSGSRGLWSAIIPGLIIVFASAFVPR